MHNVTTFMELDLSLNQNLDAAKALTGFPFLKQQITFFSYFRESTNIPISTYI